MKAVTGTEMGRIDKYSIEQIGIPGVVLMENAALKIFKHVQLYFQQNKSKNNKRIVIAAGKGNNAGDAFAVARHLAADGYAVKVYCLFGKESITGDARLNFDIMERVGVNSILIEHNSDMNKFTEDIQNSDMVIDGIFGTGFRGQVQGFISEVIDIINKNSNFTLSVDIASGVESASGIVSDFCIRANKTVTFEYPKIGQLLYPGVYNTGELVIESIGIPDEAAISIGIAANLTDREFVRKVMPSRGAEYNKGDCGKVLIVTGSPGMAGSGCITAKASLRTGSGLVYAAVPQSLISIYQSVVPEAVAVRLDDCEGVLDTRSIKAILNMAKKCDVAAIGPGLSAADSIYEIIAQLADNLDIPVVLDADGLNAAAKNTDIFARFKKDVVITPHPGEMSRLTGLDINHIQKNRIEVAKKYAGQWGVTVVLKGAGTIIARKDGTIFINPTGNAGMATAGCGDALTGIIASLIGQGLGAYEAAIAGVYLHGLAGDITAEAKGQHGVNAMDIVENTPFAITKTIY